MKMKGYLVFFGIVLLLGSTTLICYSMNTYFFQKKQAWVDIKILYNDFEYKKELEAKFKGVETARKKLLDSLELDLNLLMRKIDRNKPEKELVQSFEIKKEQYLYKKEQFAQENTETQQNYNEQILGQLNQYVKDYCKAQEYDFVYGADGNGSLMYASETKDITKEVLVYVNNKYKGAK